MKYWDFIEVKNSIDNIKKGFHAKIKQTMPKEPKPNPTILRFLTQNTANSGQKSCPTIS